MRRSPYGPELGKSDVERIERERAGEIVDRAFFVLGPTASGKSDIAEHLAPLMGAEIISLDSMSVYRGMDIGTAKPSPEVRRRIPHHLVDIIPPTEEFSAARYVRLALDAAEDILEREATPLFVGGTPLYVRLLLEGMFNGPGANPELRRELHLIAQSEEGGAEELHRRLAAVDPETAAGLHPNDTRRIIRALEVYNETGRPISSLRKQWSNKSLLTSSHNLAIIGRDGFDLKERIRRRVDEMFGKGLTEEARGLLEKYGRLSRTAGAAVGYAEAIDHIENGVPIEETIERVKTRTWRVARKQLAWFRRFDPECGLPVEKKEFPENTAIGLYMRLRRCHNRYA